VLEGDVQAVLRGHAGGVRQASRPVTVRPNCPGMVQVPAAIALSSKIALTMKIQVHLCKPCHNQRRGEKPFGGQYGIKMPAGEGSVYNSRHTAPDDCNHFLRDAEYRAYVLNRRQASDGAERRRKVVAERTRELLFNGNDSERTVTDSDGDEDAATGLGPRSMALKRTRSDTAADDFEAAVREAGRIRAELAATKAAAADKAVEAAQAEADAARAHVLGVEQAYADAIAAANKAVDEEEADALEKAERRRASIPKA
jgi:hypothetical protein